MSLLSGWKEIADHMHTGVRTAQRWERFGLPVRRVSESSCSPVVAISEDIEQWARKRQTKVSGYALVKSASLTGKFAELRSEQRRAFRRTQTILKQIQNLGLEQKRLLSLIRSQATKRAKESQI
jgi:hypothetical protein